MDAHSSKVGSVKVCKQSTPVKQLSKNPPCCQHPQSRPPSLLKEGFSHRHSLDKCGNNSLQVTFKTWVDRGRARTRSFRHWKGQNQRPYDLRPRPFWSHLERAFNLTIQVIEKITICFRLGRAEYCKN